MCKRKALCIRNVLWTTMLLGSVRTTLGAQSPAEPAPKTVVEWRLGRAADLARWQPNAHLAEVRTVDGTLQCRGVGPDPILELRAPFEVLTTPWQALEVTLKASRDGVAEFFWSHTAEGRYGGFSQEKTTRFPVTGDGQWATYRVLPCWQSEGKIIRLRFDLYDGADFALEAIRVVGWLMPPPAEAPDFTFPAADAVWTSLAIGRLSARGEATLSSERLRLAPPVQIDAETLDYVSLGLRLPPTPEANGKAGQRPAELKPAPRATLFFATQQSAGLKSLSFPVQPDGQDHVYNLDMLAASDWRGRIVALGLRSTTDTGAAVQCHWLKATDRPQGPAQLAGISLVAEEALPRAGLPVTLTASFTNDGGADALKVVGDLALPPGVTAVARDTVQRMTERVSVGETVVWRWTVESAQPVTAEAEVRVKAEALAPQSARCRLTFTARPAVERTDYVPEPKPVRGAFEVGVYYFPGWKTSGQWHPIQRFPERRPVLGWYREGDPEVADWHIKWAVEHGITFFAYDWYWSRGARQLEHALHDGYFQARYRRYLKFCLLWANHNAPGTSSPEDCVAVTRHWIAEYFRRPEHLTVGGRPVVIIFSPDRLTADLGAGGVKPALEAMRDVCREAGLPGLVVVACVADAAQARQAATEGYDAVSAYNWVSLGMPNGQMEAPYATLLEGYRRNWQHIVETAPVPLWLPLSGGWDSRPWHGANNLIRFGRTPALFQQHLEDACRFGAIPEFASRISNLVLIEAWNEFGEGSYIEPHQEFGFGYLDAIRTVFTKAPSEHVDLTPQDVGRGPYEVPTLPPRRPVWTFDRDDDGWVQTMDLTVVTVANGALAATSTGNDPAFFGPPFEARADEFGTVVVRLKLRPTAGGTGRDRAQLFWRTTRLPESEANSTRFEVVADGAWHEYRVPVAQNHRWRGTITRLRLDPCNQRGMEIALDEVRLAPQ